MTAREVALLVARDVFPPQPEATQRGAQESLDYRVRAAGLDARDRAFATNLAFGAIKMRRTVDWYLHPYLSSRAKPLPPAVAEILRLAVYELQWTAAVARAVVSEWVNLAKKYGHRGTAGLVNAVLRAMLRDAPKAPGESDFTDRTEYLGTRYSYPTWIVRQFRATFGDERAEAILKGCNEPAAPAVTINRMKTTRAQIQESFARENFAATFSQLAQDSLLIDRGAVGSAMREASGAWWIQSESSAAVVDVLNPQPGESVVDACSGRGNKALQIAARLHGEGTIVCIDRDARKMVELERRAHEAELTIAQVTGDASIRMTDLKADRVLLDAPCSGVGVLGRHPEARWRKQPNDGERLALTQRALLGALLPQLFEGGALVYAVCSTDPRETTEIVEWCLETQPVMRGLIPAQFAEFQIATGDVVIPPGVERRDGFFIARLERSA